MNLVNRVPIGQYVPGNSVLHRCDPRSKLIGVCLFLALVFLANSPLSMIVAAVVCLLGIGISRVPILYVLRGLKPALWIIVITALLQLFMNEEGRLLFSWKFLQIHEQGVRDAVLVSVRIILLMMAASLLTLTTSPIQLTDGLESLFSPLKRVGFPAHELALMMSISLRFIPTLMEETEKIAKAQMSRGASFSSGSPIKRVLGTLPIIVPLFVQSFRRAEELAFAMEARGYRGGVGRTKYRQLRYGAVDVGFGIVIVIVAVVIIVFRT